MRTVRVNRKKKKKEKCFGGGVTAAYGGSQARAQIKAVALADTTATATPGASYVCDLHHSSQQHRILNPLIEARD